MAVYTEALNTTYSFPHILIYNRFRDGEHYSYKAVTNEGYVMYDPSCPVMYPVLDENGDLTFDEEGNIIEVQDYEYFRLALLPLNTDFDNFNWVAVAEDTGPSDHIFGNDEPEHEIM